MSDFPDPVSLIVLLAAVAVVPFIAVMCTSYIKLVVVLGLVRNALGTQNIPPNLAMNGIAIVLTIYIMAPVARSAFDILRADPPQVNDLSALSASAGRVAEPFRRFLEARTPAEDRAFFVSATSRLWPPEQAAEVTERDFLVLIPAFTTTGLTEAFRIGFLLFLPFLVVDLVIANILTAMGMSMLSPTTISLPFKIFLFVMVDGWHKLIEGLVMTYTGAGVP